MDKRGSFPLPSIPLSEVFALPIQSEQTAFRKPTLMYNKPHTRICRIYTRWISHGYIYDKTRQGIDTPYREYLLSRLALYCICKVAKFTDS